MSIDRVDVELIVLKVVVVVMTAQNDVESLHFESKLISIIDKRLDKYIINVPYLTGIATIELSTSLVLLRIHRMYLFFFSPMTVVKFHFCVCTPSIISSPVLK